MNKGTEIVPVLLLSFSCYPPWSSESPQDEAALWTYATLAVSPTDSVVRTIKGNIYTMELDDLGTWWVRRSFVCGWVCLCSNAVVWRLERVLQCSTKVFLYDPSPRLEQGQRRFSSNVLTAILSACSFSTPECLCATCMSFCYAITYPFFDMFECNDSNKHC